jgi:hypothetical protein
LTTEIDRRTKEGSNEGPDRKRLGRRAPVTRVDERPEPAHRVPGSVRAQQAIISRARSICPAKNLHPWHGPLCTSAHYGTTSNYLSPVKQGNCGCDERSGLRHPFLIPVRSAPATQWHSPDHWRGARPHVHSSCSLVRLSGDLLTAVADCTF